MSEPPHFRLGLWMAVQIHSDGCWHVPGGRPLSTACSRRVYPHRWEAAEYGADLPADAPRCQLCARSVRRWTRWIIGGES